MLSSCYSLMLPLYHHSSSLPITPFVLPVAAIGTYDRRCLTPSIDSLIWLLMCIIRLSLASTPVAAQARPTQSRTGGGSAVVKLTNPHLVRRIVVEPPANSQPTSNERSSDGQQQPRRRTGPSVSMDTDSFARK